MGFGNVLDQRQAQAGALDVMYQPGAHAVEALAGKAIGAGDRKDFYRATRATGQWSLITALGFALVYNNVKVSFFFSLCMKLRDSVVPIFQ